MKALGSHLIVEMYECDKDILNSIEDIERYILEAVKISEAELVKPVFHKFSPHGVSGVAVIAESHFAIHTWPEYGYCALDIFTCGTKIKSEKALTYLKESLKCDNISVMETKRGILHLPVEKIMHKPGAEQ